MKHELVGWMDGSQLAMAEAEPIDGARDDRWRTTIAMGAPMTTERSPAPASVVTMPAAQPPPSPVPFLRIPTASGCG